LIFFPQFTRVRACGVLLAASLLAGSGVCATFAQAPAATGQHAAGPRFVVVLDAAHGGDDGGGQVGGSVAEKTVTLALSVRLRSLLTARGFSVVTTREGNVNLDSDARAQIANHALARDRLA
jgi:N-acetylmuramoyl-L-alanine amidase